MKLDEIKEILSNATPNEFAAIERSLQADQRKGVQTALRQAKKRIDAEIAEAKRLDDAIAFQAEVVERAGGGVAVGLDEVGRGPLAGPLTIGAVVLPEGIKIEGLNDSKSVSEDMREALSGIIRSKALAYSVVHIQPEFIDANGMTASLKKAFTQAIQEIEKQIHVDVVLLDGNPLHIDDREVNIVKGDVLCPSISAASIIAKVERDALMREFAKTYPQYGFEIHKGYGTEMHRCAIEECGLSAIHRKSFCTAFSQERLF